MASPALSLDQRLARHLLANNLVATTAEAAALGIDRQGVDRRVRNGLLIRLGRGAVGLSGAPDPVRQRRAAALAVRPDAVLAGLSAASVHGMPVGQRSLETEPVLLVQRNGSRRASLGRILTTRHLAAADLVAVDGLRVTSPERTLLDLVADLRPAHLRWMGERLILDGQVDPDELLACGAGLRRQGRRGAKAQGELLAHLIDDAPTVASDGERRFADLLTGAGITGWVTQFQPPWYDGIHGVVDFAWPDLAKIIEVDSRRWHASTQDQTAERRRDRLARGNGWQTERFTYQEIVRRPATVVDWARAFLA